MPTSMPNHRHGQNQSKKVGREAKPYQYHNTKSPQCHGHRVAGTGAQAGDGCGPGAGVAVQHEWHGDDADAENKGGKHGTGGEVDEQKRGLFKRKDVNDDVGKSGQGVMKVMGEDAH